MDFDSFFVRKVSKKLSKLNFNEKYQHPTRSHPLTYLGGTDQPSSERAAEKSINKNRTNMLVIEKNLFYFKTVVLHHILENLYTLEVSNTYENV